MADKKKDTKQTSTKQTNTKPAPMDFRGNLSMPFGDKIDILGAFTGKPSPSTMPNQLFPTLSKPAPAVAKPQPKPVPVVAPQKMLGIPPINEPVPVGKVENPVIPEAVEDTNGNFLASLLGQGIAMMGSGIRGGDPGQVGQIIEQNRFNQGKYADEKQRLKQTDKERMDQIDFAKKLMNPDSEESKRRRLVYGHALGVQIPNNYSGSDLQDPNIIRAIQEREMMNLKIGSMRGIGGGGASGQKSAKPTKPSKELTEIKIRSKVVNDALDKLDSLIEKKGTYEAFGSHNKEIDQLINSIAVNYNKILDPTSVVREGEAAQVAESLGLGGNFRMLTSDKTARDQLKSFKNLVNNQTKASLQNYMELPSETDFNPQEKQLVDMYRENPDNPNVQRVYEKMLQSKGIR